MYTSAFLSASFISILILSGCGPHLHPMALRLPAEEQAKLDAGWDRILTDPREVDRGLVLDAFVLSQIHHAGVDTFWYRAEKRYAGGWIVISSYFERSDPSTDRVDIEIVDHDRLLLRRLTYSGREVKQAAADLHPEPFIVPIERRHSTERSNEAVKTEVDLRRERVIKFFEPERSNAK